jgi:hypothetical protein
MQRTRAFHCQKCRTENAPNNICNEVGQSCLTTGEIHLMPFVERTDQQSAKKSDSYFVPSTQIARQTYCASKQGKNTGMNHFIPRVGYQADSYRLPPPQ